MLLCYLTRYSPLTWCVREHCKAHLLKQWTNALKASHRCPLPLQQHTRPSPSSRVRSLKNHIQGAAKLSYPISNTSITHSLIPHMPLDAANERNAFSICIIDLLHHRLVEIPKVNIRMHTYTIIKSFWGTTTSRRSYHWDDNFCFPVSKCGFAAISVHVV